MIIDNDGKVIVNDDGNPLFAVSSEASPILQYYFGIFQQTTRPVISQVGFAGMTLVESSSNIPVFQLTYPEQIGFIFFAEPLYIALRTAWEVDSFNTGPIKGAWNVLNPNFFPDAEIRSFENQLYRVYLSSYASMLSKPIKFIQ